MPNTSDDEDLPIELASNISKGKLVFDYSSDDTYEHDLSDAHGLEKDLNKFNLFSYSSDDFLSAVPDDSSASYAHGDNQLSSNIPTNDTKDGYDWEVKAGTITLQFYTELAPLGVSKPAPVQVGSTEISIEGLTSKFDGIRWVVNGHGHKLNNMFELPELTLITPSDLRWPFITDVDRDYHLEKDFRAGQIKPLQNNLKWKFYYQEEMLSDIELLPWQGYIELEDFSRRLLRDEKLWSKVDGELGLLLNRDPQAMLIVKCNEHRYIAKQGKQIQTYLESIIKNSNIVPTGEIPLLFLSPKIGKVKVLSSTTLSEVSSILSKTAKSAFLLCASCNALRSHDRLIEVDTDAPSTAISILSKDNDKRILSYSSLLDNFIKHDAELAHKAAIRFHGGLSNHIKHSPLTKNQSTYDFEVIIKSLLQDNQGGNVHFHYDEKDCYIMSSEFNLSLTHVLENMNWQFVDAQSFSSQYEHFLFYGSHFKPRTIKRHRINDKVDFDLQPGLHSQLTFGEMAALNIYTQETSCSDAGKSIYVPLNQLLWSKGTTLNTFKDNPMELKELLIHACFIASAINHADKTKRKYAYRVEGGLPDNVFQARMTAAREKRPYYEGGFISASGSSKKAMDAKGGKLLTHHTIFHNVTGIDLGELSYYGLNEDEILIPPGPIQYDHLSTRDYLSVSIAHPVMTPLHAGKHDTKQGVGHFDELCYFEFHNMTNQLYRDLGANEKLCIVKFLQSYHPMISQCFSHELSDYNKSKLFYDVLSKLLTKLDAPSTPDPLLKFRERLKEFIDFNHIFASLDHENFENILYKTDSIQTIRDAVAERFNMASTSRCGARWFYDAQGFVYTKVELEEILSTIEHNSLDKMSQCAIFERIPDIIYRALQRVLEKTPQTAAKPTDSETKQTRTRRNSL